MGKPAVRLGAVPVLYLRRDDNDRAGRQANSILAFFLIPALAGCADQDLPAAALGMMDMPVVAASRFKGDVRKPHRTFAVLCQRVQIGIADEKLGKGGIGLPLTENILLVNMVLS